MYSILAGAVEISEDGQVVKVVKSFPVEIMPFVVVMFIVATVIFAVLYKKFLEHKQIMTAIEKGTNLSELRPFKKQSEQQNLIPAWIRNLTAGIALTIIGLTLACIVWFSYGGFAVDGTLTKETGLVLFIAVIVFAFGISRLIRGILLRKADKQSAETNSNHST